MTLKRWRSQIIKQDLEKNLEIFSENGSETLFIFENHTSHKYI